MAGRLVYLMGPSGAGKDTILLGLRARLGDRAWIAPRLVTRETTHTEPGAIPVTHAEFAQLERSGALSMSWRANGLAYGVRIELDARLSSGCDVLLNGSRDYLPQARSRYPGLVPVLLTVADDALYQRLLTRGRESHEQIRARLHRNARYRDWACGADVGITVLDNSGPVEHAIEALYETLARNDMDTSQPCN